MLARGALRMRKHDDRKQNDAPNADRVRADCRPRRILFPSALATATERELGCPPGRSGAW